ncbi:MAG: hypothetical protein FRX49_08629 [Trebouxia sp. A1-2]|nr:MAG: hypothetical protein FRX49_08629 [Trebouxia sp. A1-2]
MSDLFDTSDKGQLALNVLLVAAYLGLNSILNLTNKWALGVYGFTFPLLLTTCHMAFSFCVLLPFMIREPFRSKHHATLEKQWKGLVAIGVYMAANVSLNNLSLVLITLSLNQVIRSAIPVCTATLAVFIEKKIPTGEEATGLIILTLGVMVAVWEGSVSGSVTGLLLCCAGTVCNAAMMSTAGKSHSQRFAVYWVDHSTGVLLVLVCSSIVALSYNVIHSLMIQKTSAVTTTVLGEVKIVGLLLLSALLLGEKKAFTGKMTVGVTLAMIGFCMYSHTKLKLRPQPARTEDAASSTKQARNAEEGMALVAEPESQANTPTSASLVHRS